MGLLFILIIFIPDIFIFYFVAHKISSKIWLNVYLISLIITNIIIFSNSSNISLIAKVNNSDGFEYVKYILIILLIATGSIAGIIGIISKKIVMALEAEGDRINMKQVHGVSLLTMGVFLFLTFFCILITIGR